MRKTILEKIFKAPALILEEGVKLEQEIKNDIKRQKPVKLLDTFR